MSRSNNQELINPSARFYEWSGETGGFRYWDKQAEKRIAVPLPFRFLVLDTLATVKGFDDTNQSGYWSNEIRDIKRDILTVRNKTGIVAKGLYEEVITDRNCTGAKFCQSVYVAVKEDDGTFVIANIGMRGAALGAWIDFRKKNKIMDGAIEVSSMIEGKKGKTVYQIPVFTKIETSEETNLVATDLDKELQEYLVLYFKKTRQEVADIHTEEKVSTNQPDAPQPRDTDMSDPLGVDDSNSLPF